MPVVRDTERRDEDGSRVPQRRSALSVPRSLSPPPAAAERTKPGVTVSPRYPLAPWGLRAGRCCGRAWVGRGWKPRPGGGPRAALTRGEEEGVCTHARKRGAAAGSRAGSAVRWCQPRAAACQTLLPRSVYRATEFALATYATRIFLISSACALISHRAGDRCAASAAARCSAWPGGVSRPGHGDNQPKRWEQPAWGPARPSSGQGGSCGLCLLHAAVFAYSHLTFRGFIVDTSFPYARLFSGCV